MKQRNRIAVLLLVILAAAIGYYFLSTDQNRGLTLIGTVDANQVIVSPKIQGRIEKLLVKEGSQVKQGDLIAVLDQEELQAEKRAAEATLASLRSQVSASQATEQSTAGQTTSDVLSAQAKVQSTRAQLEQAVATLDRQSLDTKRTVSLADQGIASQQDRDTAVAALKAQQAAVQSLRDQVRAAESDLASAQARTHQAHAAQSTVASMQAQMLMAQAQLAQAETRLSYTQILAPVTGTVSVRAAREGEVVNIGSPIVTIVDYGDTWVYAAVPETYENHIRLGDKLTVRLPSGDTTQGQVILKAAEGDFATQRDVSRSKRDIRTVGLRVRVNNSRAELVPGMTATVLVPQAMLREKETAQNGSGKQGQ